MISESSQHTEVTHEQPDHVVDEAFAVAETYRRRFPSADIEGIAAFFSLGLALAAATQVSDRFFAGFGYGLNTARYSLLRALYLSEERQRPLNDIAREMGVTSQNVTYLLSTLERKGLVGRIASETDRRVFHAHLTPAGEELCANLLPATLRFLEELAEPFSREDKKTLTELLGKLRKHVLNDL